MRIALRPLQASRIACLAPPEMGLRLGGNETTRRSAGVERRRASCVPPGRRSVAAGAAAGAGVGMVGGDRAEPVDLHGAAVGEQLLELAAGPLDA